MKKVLKIIGLAVCVLILVWAVSIVYVNILTGFHGDAFTDLEAMEITYLHAWEGEPEIRVLSYWGNSAVVYFFNASGGEKIKLIRENSGWKYEKTLAIWSGTGGSADDYFIWPYYKNWVF